MSQQENFSVVMDWISGTDDDIIRNSANFPVEGTKWNIISSKWLAEWKEKIKNNTNLIKKIDNSDLIDTNPLIWKLENEMILKKNLELFLDYEILPTKAWKYFESNYECEENSEIIKYSVADKNNETYVEIYSKPLKMIYYYKTFCKKTLKIFLSYKDTIRNLYIKLKKLLKIYKNIEVLDSEIRVWIVNPSLSESQLFLELSKESRVFPGNLLENSLKTIEDYPIADDDLIFLEIKSENFQFSEQKPEIFKSSTKTQSNRTHGIVGLHNLGNTCYMNSALQCLSNTQDLTRYILSKKYESEINYQNPLGTKGNLITEYSYLITEMWKGASSELFPYRFKKAFCMFAKQFEGTFQHDCQEMLSFLIDGIHEDLNRVNPLSLESKTMNQLNAEDFWNFFMRRNCSIITDLMYGQFKSKIVCPNQHVSLTFDPFLMISVPIPRNDKRIFNIKFIKLDPSNVIIDCRMCGNIGSTVLKIREYISEIMQVSIDKLQVGSGVNQYCVNFFLKDDDVVDYCSDILVYEVPKGEFVFIEQRKRKDIISTQSGPIVGYTRIMATDLKNSFQNLFLQIYEFLKFVLKDCPFADFAEILNRQGTDFPGCFTLNFVSTRKHLTPCKFCLKSCNNCRVPYEDKVLESCFGKEKFIVLEILWSRSVSENIRNQLNKTIKDASVERENKILNQLHSTPITLNQCIKEFSKPEKLDQNNKTFCIDCNKLVEGVKKMEIWKASKILIFHIKRFKQARGYKIKDNKFIDYPIKALDLTEICHINGGVYDLYAVCNHYGDLNYGHYTCFAYNYKKQSWFEFDDSKVTRLDESHIVSSEAYLLFYRLRV